VRAWLRYAAATTLLASCTKDAAVAVSPGHDGGTATDGAPDVTEASTIAPAIDASTLDADNRDAFDPFGPFDRATPGRPDAKGDVSAIAMSDDAGDTDEDAWSADAKTDGTVGTVTEAGADCTTTECVFAAQPVECLSCDRDQGACLDPSAQSLRLCEMMAPLSPDRSEAKICIQVLQAIISSGCAADGQLNACLCGDIDGFQCQSGAAEPKGPLYELYADDFSPGTRKIADIVSNFTNPVYGAGAANAMVQCLAAFGCDRCLTPAIPAGSGQ
jgi:hypothetical protein